MDVPHLIKKELCNMTFDIASRFFEIPVSGSELKFEELEKQRTTYPLKFEEASGRKGDLCYYVNYGIDTYRSGCYHNCKYCFAKQLNKKRSLNNWKINDPSVIDTKSVAKQFKDAFETGKKATKVTSILRQRIPIKIGRNSDPFQPIERKIGATFKTLKIFHRYRYPFILSTKSDMVADDKYLELYRPDSTYVQMTVTSLNEKLVSKMEPNAPLPRKRIRAIEKLNEIGIKTAFRIQPLLPVYPDSTLSGMYPNRQSIKSDYFTFDLADELVKVKPHCIIAGFLKVYDINVYKELSDAGLDMAPYYRLNPKYFSPREITQYFTRIKKKCDDAGVNFSVCFDNASNFERFRYLWSNTEDCCCAKGMIEGFTKTARDVK
jgi:DNA repair photolyase